MSEADEVTAAKLTQVYDWTMDMINLYVHEKHSLPEHKEMYKIIAHINELNPYELAYFITLLINSVISLNMTLQRHNNNLLFEGFSLKTGVVF